MFKRLTSTGIDGQIDLKKKKKIDFIHAHFKSPILILIILNSAQ